MPFKKLFQIISELSKPAMTAPAFDYHLLPKEQKNVESLVPLNQAKIHLAFRAEIIYGGKKYSNAACSLSEHMVTLAKRRIIGSSYALLDCLHLMTLKEIKTTDIYTCQLDFGTQKVEIISPIVLRFARCLIRNYLVATMLYPPEKRAAFKPHDFHDFPPFDPHLSPSQMFQFTYNAFCSYYNTQYFHSVSKFFHRMAICNSGIANIGRLPLHELECGFGDPMDLRPIFAAIGYSPIINGIICNNIMRPDLIRAASLALSQSKTIRVVSLAGCKCQTGLQELSNSIIANSSLKVSFWDLSNNLFDAVLPFAAALSKAKSPVYYLNLSSCGLTAADTLGFLRAIHANKNLWEIRYLNLGGSGFDLSCIEVFASHLKTLSVKGKTVIKFLDLGQLPSESGYIFQALTQFPQPIESLQLCGSKFSESSFSDLVKYISETHYLKHFDISNTNLSAESVARLISCINANEGITEISLIMNSLSLSGKRLTTVFSSFDADDLGKWKMLGLDSNEISPDELHSLIPTLRRLIHLRSISLGGNFKCGQKNIEDSLGELLSIESLEEIHLKGTAKRYIGSQLIPFIRILNRIKIFDASNNQIGDDGLIAIANMAESNKQLREVYADGSKPHEEDSIVRLFDVLSTAPNLIQAPFPIDDIYSISGSMEKGSRAASFEMMANKQKRVSENCEKNMLSQGLGSELMKLNITEVNELLDSMTIDVQKRLEGIQVNHHSGINKAFGLPLPYMEENQILADTPNAETANDSYELPETKLTIVETIENDENQFKTLQFNSLCIRRNKTTTKVFKQAEVEDSQSAAMVPPSSFDLP